MEPGNFIIRKARPSDGENIYRLLHSESIPWDMKQIEENIENLYVAVHESKLVCVACCDTDNRSIKIKWTAVHPMYPEGKLSSAVCGFLLLFQSDHPGKTHSYARRQEYNFPGVLLRKVAFLLFKQ